MLTFSSIFRLAYGASIFATTSFSGPQLGITHRLETVGGATVPALGFGTYRAEPERVGEAVKYAIQCGYRHIDCAKIYGNQREVGRAIAECIKSNVVKREELFIAGKCWPTQQHPDNVAAACRDTLEELQLDYLDLYMPHWPIAWQQSSRFDGLEFTHPKDANGNARVLHDVTLLDTWRAMEELVDKKFVRLLGVSNCGPSDIEPLVKDGKVPVSTNQVELHPACQQRQLKQYHASHKILTVAYCPLGMPTRFTPPSYKGLSNYKALFNYLTERTGFTPQRILLNWNLDQFNSVLVKSLSKEHIKSNAKAALYTLPEGLRLSLYVFQDKIAARRVINPTDFRADGKRFFDEDNVEYLESGELIKD